MVANPRHSDSPLPCLNGERFFFGHVPHSIIRLLSNLPGCSLATYMAIWDRSKLEGRGVPVTLPNAFALDPWGVDRHSKGRALRVLEGAGLISVTDPRAAHHGSGSLSQGQGAKLINVSCPHCAHPVVNATVPSRR